MKLALLFLILLALPGCASTPSARLLMARKQAAATGLQEQDVVASPFILRAYTRLADPHAETVRIYIEGDGLAWLDRATPSPDPTPRHPLGLALAAADPGANVIYLARPCQYIARLADGDACPQRYWTDALFAPEVIDAYDQALDGLKARYGFQKMELVGYSGGGGLAVLIAAKRHDLTNLRTVAGNLDIGLFSQLHNISPLSHSQNPAAVADRLATLPQLHFIGGDDVIVPPAILNSFETVAGNPACVKGDLIQGMAHEGDWPSIWPDLLRSLPMCTAVGGGTH